MTSEMHRAAKTIVMGNLCLNAPGKELKLQDCEVKLAKMQFR